MFLFAGKDNAFALKWNGSNVKSLSLFHEDGMRLGNVKLKNCVYRLPLRPPFTIFVIINAEILCLRNESKRTNTVVPSTADCAVFCYRHNIGR